MSAAGTAANAEPLSSPVFRPGAGACARVQAAGIVGKAMAAVAVTLLVLTVVAANYDWRWAVVGLMALFLVFPMLALLVWLKALGNTAYAPAMKMQRWQCNAHASELTVHFLAPGDDGEATVTAILHPLTVVGAERCGRYAVVRLSAGAPVPFLIAPVDCLPLLLAQKFNL